MAALMECRRCGTRSWNRFEFNQPLLFDAKLSQSIHVAEEGNRCPQCGDQLGELIGDDPRDLPRPAEEPDVDEVIRDNMERALMRARVHIKGLLDMQSGRWHQGVAFRPDLYALAHFALPLLGLAPMPGALSLFHSELAPRALSGLVEIVADSFAPLGLACNLAPADLGRELWRIEDAHCVVITLPAPEASPEAFFVAFTVESTFDGGMISTEDLGTRKVRCFPLEMTRDGRPILCEWQDLSGMGGSRTNYRSGPRPEIPQLVRYVERLHLAGPDIFSMYQRMNRP